MAKGGGDPQVYTQDSYRGRNDIFNESIDNGWFAATDIDWNHSLDLDTTWRLRLGVRRDADANTSTKIFRLYYSHNEGSFTQITTTSSVVKSVVSGVSGYDNGDDSTQLITTGSYEADNNFITVNTSSINSNWGSSAGADLFAETEWTLQFISSDITSGDTIEFRLRDTDGGAIEGGYEQIPIVTILLGSRIKMKSGTVLIKSGTTLIK